MRTYSRGGLFSVPFYGLDESGKHGYEKKKATFSSDLDYQSFSTQGRLTSSIADKGVSRGAWEHAEEGGDHVVEEPDLGQTEGVVQNVEREQRDQSGEGNKAPSFNRFIIPLDFFSTQSPAR